MLRDMRDLTEHPVNPVEVVAASALEKSYTGVLKPLLQGASVDVVPYLMDGLFYLSRDSKDGSRKLLTQSTDFIAAGNRAEHVLPRVITDPTIPGISGCCVREAGRSTEQHHQRHQHEEDLLMPISASGLPRDPEEGRDMPSVEIDWESMLETLPEEAPTRELIPPGQYTVKVEKAEPGFAKSGNAKIELTLTVDEGEYKGRTVWGRINFATNSPNSMAITVDQLAQFGITRKWLALNSPTTDQIARKLVGERVTVKVSHREWENEQYYDVKGYKAVTAPADPF